MGATSKCLPVPTDEYTRRVRTQPRLQNSLLGQVETEKVCRYNTVLMHVIRNGTYTLVYNTIPCSPIPWYEMLRLSISEGTTMLPWSGPRHVPSYPPVSSAHTAKVPPRVRSCPIPRLGRLGPYSIV